MLHRRRRMEGSNGSVPDTNRVRGEEDTIKETLKSTLGRNKVYSRDEVGGERAIFRAELRRTLRNESQRYRYRGTVSDAEHCAAIRRISDGISTRFSDMFVGGRFRYGTAQKALNLYLKYLWRLRALGDGKPPHCPVDSIVMQAAGLSGSWTRSDNEQESISWINWIRRVASPGSIADWEYGRWQPTMAVGPSSRCA